MSWHTDVHKDIQAFLGLGQLLSSIYSDSQISTNTYIIYLPRDCMEMGKWGGGSNEAERHFDEF